MLGYRREVYRWAADEVRAVVTATTWSAFHLTHVEGVSIADAAAQLGLSVGNVYIARSRVISRDENEEICRISLMQLTGLNPHSYPRYF